MKIFGIENTGSFSVNQIVDQGTLINISASYAETASFALNGGGGGGGTWYQLTIPTMSQYDSASFTGSIANTAFTITGIETVQYEGIDSDTILAMHFDKDGVIIDSTGKHTVTTGSSGPTFANEFVRFGDDSAYLPNNNNAYMIIPYTASEMNLSQSAFTIDFWIRPSAINRYQSVWNQGINSTNRNYCIILNNNTMSWVSISTGSANFNAISDPIPNYTQDTWYHMAFVKDPFGTDPKQVMFFVNGELLTATTESGDWANIESEIRAFVTYYPTTTTTNTYGYIDELRYSKVARWNENFIVPQRAYEISGSARMLASIGNDTTTNGYKAEVTASGGGDAEDVSGINIVKLSPGTSTNVVFNIVSE